MPNRQIWINEKPSLRGARMSAELVALKNLAENFFAKGSRTKKEAPNK